MNREIKFRAWDKTKKVMLPVKLLDFAEWWVSCNPVGASDPLEYGERNSFKNVETDRHVLMQFTGLNDKNGVEVYEGDILKNSRGIVLKVVYGEGCYFAEGISHKGNEICHILRTYNTWSEVIGNLFENGELLNES